MGWRPPLCWCVGCSDSSWMYWLRCGNSHTNLGLWTQLIPRLALHLSNPKPFLFPFLTQEDRGLAGLILDVFNVSLYMGITPRVSLQSVQWREQHQHFLYLFKNEMSGILEVLLLLIKSLLMDLLGFARLNPILSASDEDFLKMANEWFGFGFFIWMHILVILYVNNMYFTFSCSKY